MNLHLSFCAMLSMLVSVGISGAMSIVVSVMEVMTELRFEVWIEVLEGAKLMLDAGTLDSGIELGIEVVGVLNFSVRSEGKC